MLGNRLQMNFEPATGTIAIITISKAGERPLTEDATERAIAAASPVAGSCYEELVEWIINEFRRTYCQVYCPL